MFYNDFEHGEDAFNHFKITLPYSFFKSITLKVAKKDYHILLKR